MAKQGLHEVVEPWLTEDSAEVRHGLRSHYIETQQIRFLPGTHVIFRHGPASTLAPLNTISVIMEHVLSRYASSRPERG
jgi:hypothetical protein